MNTYKVRVQDSYEVDGSYTAEVQADVAATNESGELLFAVHHPYRLVAAFGSGRWTYFKQIVNEG